MDVPAHTRRAVEQTVAVCAAVAPGLSRVGGYGILRNVVTPHEAVMEGEKKRTTSSRSDRVEEGRRPTVTFRCRQRVKDALQAAASANDHSLSEEIEKRLERSFANDEMRSIIREELAAAVPEISGGPVNIDARGMDHETLTAALCRFHRETKIHG